MGACATKPKVLKDGDDRPVSPQPEPLPPLKEEEELEEKAAQTEAVNDAPIESPAKNLSLGNLFIKESEDAKISPGSENENAANSSQENAIKAPEVARENTKALEILPAQPVTTADVPVEKEAIKAPGIIGKEDTEALPAPASMTDVPIEKDADKAAEEVVNKEYTEASEKLPALGSIEKMDSQASEIVPEDYADALPAPASPVVVVVADDAPAAVISAPEIVNKANSNASENVKEMFVLEKSVAESLEKIPTPTPSPTPAATEAYFPTGKIVSQFSEEYTDALADAPTEKVAVGTDEVVVLNNNTNAEQTEEGKLKPAQDAKLIQITEETIPPLNREDKKTIEENAVVVEKQIEVGESVNPTQESDIKQVKSVEIISEK